MESSSETPNASLNESRAWYSAQIAAFLKSERDAIVGCLAVHGSFALLPTQKNAWMAQIAILQRQLAGLTGTILFEFNIPRMGRRIDAVIIIRGIVFVVEFKVGVQVPDRAAFEQVWDYGLDLKNFHEPSHTIPILPILVGTEATSCDPIQFHRDNDDVYRPILVHPDGIRTAIDRTLEAIDAGEINGENWARGRYYPTPTIIEAARSLYARHSVESIARHDAGRQNLRITSRRVEELVAEARLKKEKIICFVTGVPGAGKTLVGLNIATRHSDTNESTHAVFLSGNGPLVAVLREALTRDEWARKQLQKEKIRKGAILTRVKAFIQNVHHFRDEGLNGPAAPSDHVVIFDEAQRAWNLKQTASFMRQKKNHPGFSQSEPEFLISYMDRHPDWAVIVCLVGGGQEINTGEAGINAWLEAVSSKFPHWHVYMSSKLTDAEYAAGEASDMVQQRVGTHFDDQLHLGVSVRSFRSEKVSRFVKALLDCDIREAREVFSQICNRYPIVLSRDLTVAKQWIRSRARGSERFGLVASSKAQRLKPHAIDIRVDVNPVQWFLNDRDDTRSSFYLEDAATEFQVQGLELDWTCVTWDADLRFDGSSWSFHDFRGSRWCNVINTDNQTYLRNAYRVLLTRARQGMVIFVPEGESSDPTRPPAYYDRTYNYLTEIGIRSLD